MLFSKAGREKVERILDMVEGEGRAVVMLEARMKVLEDQNQQLFDRLMAVDWEKYAMFRPDKADATYHPMEAPLAEVQLEDNAGEILEIEE